MVIVAINIIISHHHQIPQPRHRSIITVSVNLRRILINNLSLDDLPQQQQEQIIRHGLLYPVHIGL